MKSIRKVLLMLLIVVATAALVVGCAGNGGSNSGGVAGSSDKTSASHSARQSEKGESDFDDIAAVSEKYNVVFNPNYDGGTPTVSKVDAGTAVAAPAAPTRDGEYTFGNWYTDRSCTTPYDFSAAVNKNLVLFAGWVSGNVTVSFNYNYVGAPAVEKATVAKGGVATAPQEPQRDKYAFLGWFNGETLFDFTTELQSDLTLYAHWQLTQATVTFDYNFTGAPDGSEVVVDLGQTVSAPATNPARVEYDFDCWKTSAGEEYDFSAAVNEDMTLFGSWKLKTYTVTFDGNGYAAANGSALVEHGANVTDPAVKRDSFICVWKLNGEAFNFTGYTVTGNITLVADWVAATGTSVTITYYYNYENAPNNGVYYSEELTYGETTLQPDDNPSRGGDEYMFIAWYTEAACTTQYQFGTALLSNINLYAKWYSRTVFEAEYVDLTGKVGNGFSVNLLEDAMVEKDDGTAKASNGFYLMGLYYDGAYVDFIIESDRDITDAVLVMRIQTEYDDKTFNPDIFGIYVNDNDYSLEYDEITFTTDITRDSTSSARNEFVNVVITEYLELKKGENRIRFLVTNDIYHGGTRQADAPIIDCIYIYTDATLTWEPKTDNTKNK